MSICRTFIPCQDAPDQESNVAIAVGSNDEVYPISRHDLEATFFLSGMAGGVMFSHENGFLNGTNMEALCNITLWLFNITMV